MIQQSIQLLQERSKEISFGISSMIQYMRPLASIYSHRVPGFMKTQVDSIPSRKGIRILKGKSSRACRSTGRSIGSTFGLLYASFLAPLSSDLCATFFHLFYLLSPTKMPLSNRFKKTDRFKNVRFLRTATMIAVSQNAVSYTHLTLPTIYSV